MPRKAIEGELEERVGWFEQKNLLLEAQRIRMRTEYDLEMLKEIGFCNGIENYSGICRQESRSTALVPN